ncbi:hypothetical protein [Streptomyces sp. NPDC088348]|uniref:hypothetical protein n=1 Tax=Streptomyces sp. NPDC088348 TaxID=3365853 RepID=UPI0038083DD7
MSELSFVFVEFDHQYWVDLPTYEDWPNSSWGSEESWSRETAELLLEFNDLRPKRREMKRLSNILIGHRRAFEATSVGMDHYLFFPEPHRPPISLHISYGPSEGDREDTLRKLAHADSTKVTSPPDTGAFETEHLGAGLRSRSHVELDDKSIATNLWYAFRNDQHKTDVVFFISTGDLGQLAAAEPYIDDFVRGASVVDENAEL